ncbi:RNA-guided endonuclease InsQ/TnpB family protein [Mycolicibacterium senegalense]|uniref:RNA-guided endonuclease InsQ/TnpB family protein n=1 Tax=Mycolicibacterium senegalense TaxID=1796 RepID=UPI003AACC211
MEAKRLRRAIARGAVIQSVTISRGGHRWYASVLVKAVGHVPASASRRQRDAGTIGVDIGVNHLAALSDGTLVDNPRHLRRARGQLCRAQRALARTEKGSQRRRQAAARVGRLHHEVAERRASTLHELTKQLATGWHTVAIEDLNVAGMTRSARGTAEQPGRNVKAKAGLNRSILDVSPGELRRQLEYKTRWYGSSIALCDRWFPSSQTCSACGARVKLTLADRVFRCTACLLVIDRDVNAALNVAAHAVTVAPGTGETLNARRAAPGPSPRVRTTPGAALKREDHVRFGGVVTPAEQSTGHPKSRRPLPSSLVSKGAAHARTDEPSHRPRQGLQTCGPRAHG